MLNYIEVRRLMINIILIIDRHAAEGLRFIGRGHGNDEFRDGYSIYQMTLFVN